jgi:hypothetical protein
MRTATVGELSTKEDGNKQNVRATWRNVLKRKQVGIYAIILSIVFAMCDTSCESIRAEFGMVFN